MRCEIKTFYICVNSTQKTKQTKKRTEQAYKISHKSYTLIHMCTSLDRFERYICILVDFMCVCVCWVFCLFIFALLYAW